MAFGSRTSTTPFGSMERRTTDTTTSPARECWMYSHMCEKETSYHEMQDIPMTDCNNNGKSDYCELYEACLRGEDLDINVNGTLDECDTNPQRADPHPGTSSYYPYL